MPTISMFYGILIRMYFAPGEHNPPHFHAYYAEFEGSYDFQNAIFVDGNIPSRQKKLIEAWAELHHDELLADWNLVMNGEDPFRISPLV
jgi:hypothetical protein